MNDRPLEGTTAQQSPTQPAVTNDLLMRAVSRARVAVLWERLWPAAAALATVIGLFLEGVRIG